jgi:hypothetical protein
MSIIELKIDNEGLIRTYENFKRIEPQAKIPKQFIIPK